MSRPESGFWKSLKRGMGDRWNAERVENRVNVGTPDVSFGIGGQYQGWIELKVLPAWPKRVSTPINFKACNWTLAQREWIIERGKAGGRCFMLAKIEDDYLLMHWRAVTLEDYRTRDDLEVAANVHIWKKRIKYHMLEAMLRLDHA